MSGPGQKWRDYFVCRGTSALTCLLQQLSAANALPAATFAASRALAGLAANPANQSDTIRVRHPSLFLMLVPLFMGYLLFDLYQAPYKHASFTSAQFVDIALCYRGQ